MKNSWEIMGGQWEVMWGLWGSWEVSEGSWEVSGGSWEVSEWSWEVSGRLKGGHGRSPGGYKMLIANAIAEQRLYPSFFGSDIWVTSESNLSPMKTKKVRIRDKVDFATKTRICSIEAWRRKFPTAPNVAIKQHINSLQSLEIVRSFLRWRWQWAFIGHFVFFVLGGNLCWKVVLWFRFGYWETPQNAEK